MSRRTCVRCNRRRNWHTPVSWCPAYIRPAPWPLRLVNRILGRLVR